jgi:rhamnogalacturonan acetylesterase
MAIPVINLSKGGRSTRTFMNEGSWSKLLAQTSPGDYVVIEMGHNDESNPTKNDRFSDRGVLPGLGNETKTLRTTGGKTETVKTFGAYLRVMIADVKKKQAIPILSGMVPRMYFKGGSLQTKWPFATYASQQAKRSGIEYLDHTTYSVKKWASVGEGGWKKYYADATHTNAKGARINAETLVEAAKCARSALAKHLNSQGQAIKASC